MSRSVGSAAKSVGATALIGLVLALLALPLCSAALTCTMPCCEHSTEPMEDHGAMPAAACGGPSSECSAGTYTPADPQIVVSQPAVPDALPAGAPSAFSNVAPSHASYRLPPQPRPSVRLYVVNDVFLI